MREHRWNGKDIVLFLSGLIVSIMLVFMTAVDVGSSPLVLFMGGALAISAMLLPGISGSFILLLLGIYPQVVEAVHERDIVVVFWVGLGCVFGILSFSKLLQWLMSRWHDSVLSFMLGVIAGALLKVWPWQQEGNGWYLPSSYELETGQLSWVWVSALVFLSGCILTHFLYKKSNV
jgi:putative membrane protein